MPFKRHDVLKTAETSSQNEGKSSYTGTGLSKLKMLITQMGHKNNINLKKLVWFTGLLVTTI